MPSNRTGSIHEKSSSSFTSSFALIAFTSTLTLFLAHLAARQPQPVLQQPAFQQSQPPPSIAPAPPTQPPPPPSVPPPPPPPPAPAPPQAQPSSAPILPPLSHSVPPLQQPTLIWLGNNGSGILYALLVLVLLFGLSGVWLERIAPSPTSSGDRFAEIEVEDYSEPSKSKIKKKMQSSTLQSDPSSGEDSEDAKFPGRWMNRMEAKLDRMQRKVDKERKQRKSKRQDDPDLSSSSTSSSSSAYEGTKRRTYRYHRSSNSRHDYRNCMDHGVRLHKRRNSYCCDHCGTIVAVCAGSGATLDAPPPPIPVLASNIPSEMETEEVTKIKVESTSTISKDEFEKAVNRELERRLRECEKRLEEEVLKRLQKEQEDEKQKEEKQCKKNDKKVDNKDEDLNGKWNEAWDNESWEKKEEKVISKTETKVEKKDEASTSSTSVTSTKEENENSKSSNSSDERKDVETKKVEVKITVKEKEKEKEKASEPQILLGILKKPQDSSKSSSESDNGKDDNEKEEHRILQKLHGFQKGISEMANDLKDEAKETVQDLGEFTQELKDEAKEKAQDVKEKAKDIVHDITHFGSESKHETDKDKKSSASQDVQIHQDSVKDQSVSKVVKEDGIEHKAAPMEAPEIQKSPKSVTFADPIQTEQEIPAIMIQPADKGKGKAREIEEEDESRTYSFSEAPMPMPDTVAPYEIDEDRFIGVKGSLSSNSSSSETSSGSVEKEKSSKVEEKTRVSITSTEDGNKVISTEKITSTEKADDDDEKEAKGSNAPKETDLTELLFEFADKIVDGFKSKGKKSKSKSKIDDDDSEVKVDVSLSKEKKTPKVEDEVDSSEANDDGEGKDVEQGNSESTVKETTKTTSEVVKESTKTETNEDVNATTKAETTADTKATTSEKEDKPKDEVMIVGKADVGQPAFTAEELYLETAKYLSERYPELVAKETVRVNSSLDQTYEEGKASLEEKKASDANDQAHQDGDEPAEADAGATLPQQDSTSTTTNIEQVTTKAQNGSDLGETKSTSGEEAMMRALSTIRQYGSGSSYSNLESKYYQSYFKPKVERSADDVLLSLINSLINKPKQSDEKPIRFAASALQGPSKIKEKVKTVKTTKKMDVTEEEVEENEANENQNSSTSNLPPERISADAIKAASIATADQITRHQARLHPQDDSFFKFLKKDTARSFDSMKDEVKDVSTKIGKFTGTLKRKVSKGSLKGSPSTNHEKSRSSLDAPERFDASQVTNIKSQTNVKRKESPTPYGIPLKGTSEKTLPTPYGLNFNKPPIKKPLVQFDRKVNVLEFHDPSTSSSNSSNSSNTTTKNIKQQTTSKTIKMDNIVKANEEEDVYARIAKLSRRLSEK